VIDRSAVHPADEHHHQTNQEEKDRDLVDPVHEPKVDVHLFPLEQIHGVQVIENPAEKHGVSYLAKDNLPEYRFCSFTEPGHHGYLHAGILRQYTHLYRFSGRKVLLKA